jgi:hypothetical protein
MLIGNVAQEISFLFFIFRVLQTEMKCHAESFSILMQSTAVRQMTENFYYYYFFFTSYAQIELFFKLYKSLDADRFR